MDNIMASSIQNLVLPILKVSNLNQAKKEKQCNSEVIEKCSQEK
jgi:hypothetical protein